MASEPICVELDEDDPENSSICVEDTERTATGDAARDYWGDEAGDPNYRSAGVIWLRETDQVVYFGGATAWETCSRRTNGARKFRKLLPL
jgi:hypothetical protein